MQDRFTRRGLLATAGLFALTAPLRAADKEPVFDDSQPTRGVAIPGVQHTDEMAAAPSIKKKVNKLQYRLAHNPASKAFKRASVRFVRWGSFLNRDA